MSRADRFGPSCCVHGCMRPVTQLGGYCLYHWMELSPLQRQSLQDDAWRGLGWGLSSGDTEPLDSLELWYRLPSYGEEEAA